MSVAAARLFATRRSFCYAFTPDLAASPRTLACARLHGLSRPLWCKTASTRCLLLALWGRGTDRRSGAYAEGDRLSRRSSRGCV